MIDCVQITRGLAPARSIKAVIDGCRSSMIRHTLIEGLSCADAKNEAVKIARRNGTDLLLAEDDAVPGSLHFLFKRESVNFAPANMKNGKCNTTRRPDGYVWYSGSVWLYIPAKILDLQDVWFIPTIFEKRGNALINKGRHPDGRCSDVFFWKTLGDLGIRDIHELPRIDHIIHPLQTGYLKS